uniref:Uncharacterized protein n=1 Tax=Kalanchoe fedtschenkoi TaxID=63787 RepID=A0A7N0VF62_KALFE
MLTPYSDYIRYQLNDVVFDSLSHSSTLDWKTAAAAPSLILLNREKLTPAAAYSSLIAVNKRLKSISRYQIPFPTSLLPNATAKGDRFPVFERRPITFLMAPHLNSSQ